MFVPGFGAFVRMHEHAATPSEDARIGLAGPLWGLGAAAIAIALYSWTHNVFWLAIVQTVGRLTLFNLGGRAQRRRCERERIGELSAKTRATRASPARRPRVARRPSAGDAGAVPPQRAAGLRSALRRRRRGALAGRAGSLAAPPLPASLPVPRRRRRCRHAAVLPPPTACVIAAPEPPPTDCAPVPRDSPPRTSMRRLRSCGARLGMRCRARLRAPRRALRPDRG